MFKLCSNIIITTASGTLTFPYVNNIDIPTSIETLTDSATIKFPKKLSWKDKPLFDLIRRGDQVSISLGYDNNLNTVFEGYIRKVQGGTPLEIECEDQMYLLKNVKLPTKHYDSLTLKDLLSQFCPSSVPFDVPDVNLGEFVIKDQPTLAMTLEYIRKEYCLNFFFRSGKLYGVMPSTLSAIDSSFQTNIFRIGQNVISNSLEYIQAEDVKIIIKAKTILKDNSKLECQAPEGESDGEIRTFHCPWANNLDDLKKFANETLQNFKVDHMQGSITVFGLPYVMKGDTIKLYDDKNKERDNKSFLAKAIRYQFGMEGYRQVIDLGIQISG
jgi:hypothetical protein